MAGTSQVRELTAKLEQGVADLFESDKFAEYLRTMSRFYQYSSRNTMLIYIQYPAATKVASYLSWKNNFNRQVKKGEHGIRILAPVPHNETKDFEKLDPETKLPVLDENGLPVMETLTRMGISFKAVNVFAYEQTEGEPLPSLAETLNGDVERYELFMDALRAVSPLPIVFEAMPPDTDGVCHFGDRIAIRAGMSQIQTASAVIHELTHAKLHDSESVAENGEPKDRRTEEVEAEGVSFVVNSHFSIDTGANSFGYIAEWSKTRELKELKASLDVIRKTAAELIGGIDEQYRTLAKERGIDLSAAAEESGAERDYSIVSDDIYNGTQAGEEASVTAELETPAQTEPETPAATDILADYERSAEVRDPRQVGLTILMTLLFEDGRLNRGNKRSRVKVEPTIGKYEIFSRDEGTPPHLTNYLYVMTASGRLAMLDETERLKDLTEARLDGHIRLLADSFEKQLASPAEWADFTAAAFLNRIDEAEAHNAPVREMREAESQAKYNARMERGKRLADEKRKVFDARVDEIAKAVERGERVKVEYDAGEYDGKNPVLELFRLYGVEIPLRTRGWVNKRLAEINGDSYSFFTKGGGNESSAFMDALRKLVKAVKLTPIEQRRGAEKPEPSANTEVKRTLEHELYEKFAALFPDFMDRKYSYLRLESGGFEPLSLEWVFGDRVSVMHTYELNGDLCYDPMMEFAVNSADGTMCGVTFEQSIPPFYQFYNDEGVGQSVDGNGNQRETPNLSARINDFAAQWFENIGGQEFMPVKAALWNDGGINDADIRVTFDKDGNVIMPESRERYELEYGFLGNGITVWNKAVLNAENEHISVAHINTDRTVDFYDADMPDGVKAQITKTAGSPDTWASGFEPARESSEPPALDLSLPDPARTQAEMFEYGYTEPDMLPLSGDRAVELFDAGHTIYLLYDDNTEAVAFDRDEIITFGDGGFCGITKTDWEMSPVRDAQSKVHDNVHDNVYDNVLLNRDRIENSREADLLFGDESKFGIYQIKDEPGLRDHRFVGYEELKRLGLRVDRANYELVYTGKLDIHDTLTNKDRIFDAFQHDSPECPPDFTGRSVSVSDVIVLQWKGEVSAHYVDSIGFVELPSFTGNERERPQNIEQEPQTFSQVGKSVADLEAEVKAGKSISVIDLAKAVNSERRTPASKGKPSLLARLDEAKETAAQRNAQPAARNNNGLEV
jgi:hypothetical protein